MTRPAAMVIRCEKCGRIHETAVITGREQETGIFVSLFTCPEENVVFLPEQEKQRFMRLAGKEERRGSEQAG